MPDNNKEEYTKEYERFIDLFKKLKSNTLEQIKNSKGEYTIKNIVIAIDEKLLEENGIDINQYWLDYLDFIIKNLPSDITKLNIDNNILNEKPGLLSKLPQITHLNLLGFGKCSYSELKRHLENSNISKVTTKLALDKDFYSIDNSIVISSGEGKRIKTPSLQLSSNLVQFDPNIQSIHLNSHALDDDDINAINDFLDSDKPIGIYKNGKLKYTIDAHHALVYNDSLAKGKQLTAVYQEPIDSFITDIRSLTKLTKGNLSIIEINVDNMTYKDFEKLKELENISKVIIRYSELSRCTIDEFISMRSTIEYFKSLVDIDSLSPAEKVCYAYDLIKSFIYQENEENKSEPRKIHSIIESGKIVCIGYARLLSELLKELGIKSYCIISESHARLIVDINDEKYDIAGSYAFDCTWDSNRNKYVVISNGEKRLITSPTKEEKIIKIYDNMSSYNSFFVPLDEYEDYFDIALEKNTRIDVIDPNKKEIDHLDNLGFRPKQKESCSFTFSEEIPEEKIIAIIYNTRSFEGYPTEINNKLIGEVSELRDMNKKYNAKKKEERKNNSK